MKRACRPSTVSRPSPCRRPDPAPSSTATQRGHQKSPLKGVHRDARRARLGRGTSASPAWAGGRSQPLRRVKASKRPTVPSDEALLAPTVRGARFDTLPGSASLDASVLPLTFRRTPELDLVHSTLFHDPSTTFEVPRRSTLLAPRKWQKTRPFGLTSSFQSPPAVVERPFRARSKESAPTDDGLV